MSPVPKHFHLSTVLTTQNPLTWMRVEVDPSQDLEMETKMRAGYGSLLNSTIYKMSMLSDTLQMKVTTDMPSFS